MSLSLAHEYSLIVMLLTVRMVESVQVTELAQVKAIMNGPLVAASENDNQDNCGLEAFIYREGANLCVSQQLWCTLRLFH